MRVPWLSDRWERADHKVAEARAHLVRAKDEQVVAQGLASEARRMREANGFAEAIKYAMGVR